MKSRPPIARIIVIYALLLREVQLDCTELAARFEVSTKTVQRDIEFMRDRLGLPLEFNSRRGTWALTAPHARPWWLVRPGDEEFHRLKALPEGVDENYIEWGLNIHGAKRYHRPMIGDAS